MNRAYIRQMEKELRETKEHIQYYPPFEAMHDQLLAKIKRLTARIEKAKAKKEWM